VVGIVSRLADQKGFDLIREAAERIMALDLALVVLGTGQREYHELFEALAAARPDRVSANLRFDDELAHWIEAGSDVFLMPSRYEPCGLNQMYSLRYGTVPVVRETGGLADTVTDDDACAGAGNGFSFREYRADAMLDALRRAVAAFGVPTRWSGIVGRGMRTDVSWTASAERYLALYGDAAGVRRRP
jgi:starch synthase